MYEDFRLTAHDHLSHRLELQITDNQHDNFDK